MIAHRFASGLLGSCLAVAALSGCDGSSSTKDAAAPPPAAPASAPAPAAADGASATPLLGTSWVLEDMGTGSLIDGVTTSLSFQHGNRVAGIGGCNGYVGTATITGDRLTFSPFTTTKATCQPNVLDQETRYLDALARAERFEIDGVVMMLYTKGASQPLRFVRLNEVRRRQKQNEG